MSRKSPHSRIHIALSERDEARLKQLIEKTNATSNSEVVKRALMVYDLLAQQLAEGSSLYIKQSDDAHPQPLHILIDVK